MWDMQITAHPPLQQTLQTVPCRQDHHFLLITPQVYLATTTSPRWPEGGSSSSLLPCPDAELAMAALSSHPQ